VLLHAGEAAAAVPATFAHASAAGSARVHPALTSKRAVVGVGAVPSDAEVVELVRAAILRLGGQPTQGDLGQVLCQSHGGLFASKNRSAERRQRSMGRLKDWLLDHPRHFVVQPLGKFGALVSCQPDSMLANAPSTPSAVSRAQSSPAPASKAAQPDKGPWSEEQLCAALQQVLRAHSSPLPLETLASSFNAAHCRSVKACSGGKSLADLLRRHADIFLLTTVGTEQRVALYPTATASSSSTLARAASSQQILASLPQLEHQLRGLSLGS